MNASLSSTAEVTHLSKQILDKLPILTGIKNQSEHQQALFLLDQLIDNYEQNLVVIEAISNVITRYEDESAALNVFNCRQKEIEPAVAALKVLMDQNGLSSCDFEKEIGNSSKVSQVLAGNINLSREQIAALSVRFKVNPAIFF